jgi:hypothetical protein
MTAQEIPRRLRHGALRGVWQLPVHWTVEQTAVVFDRIGTEIDWHTVVLDTSDCDDKASFLQACADDFALPSWFGMNWDALADCLSSLDVGESGGVLVAWVGWQTLAMKSPADFSVALEIFAEATNRWEESEVPGAIVIVGSGPEVDLRSL